jgi:ligand-binding SRPBCC domain-containing protein
MDYILERTQQVPVAIGEAFAFFSQARNLEAITPPWLRFEVLHAPDVLEHGSLLHYRLELWRVPIHWLTRIETWQPPRSFVDEQLLGPYPLWEHTHRFSPGGDGTEIYDHVRYRVPGGPLCGAKAAITVGPVYSGATRTLWRRRAFDEQLFRCEEGHVYSVRTEDGAVSAEPYENVEEWLERKLGVDAPERPPGL